MTDLHRTAHHEAAHGVLAADFGLSVHALSIRPGRSYAGVTELTNPPELLDIGKQIDGRHPLDGLPPEATHHGLRMIVQMLAGDAAADFAAPVTGRVADPLDALDRPMIEPRPPTERVRVAEALQLDNGHDDLAIATEAAYRLVGYETTGPLLRWLRAEARRVVSDRWPLITSVADALLRHQVLDADAFGRIYQPPKEHPR